jgi:succinate-acetate transporter protein
MSVASEDATSSTPSPRQSVEDPVAAPAGERTAVVANPAALGLAGFAVANLMLNVINAGWLPQSAMPAVLPLAFFAGGIAQLVAAVGEFRRGSTFGATAFGSYGIFWLSLWGFLEFQMDKFPSEAAAHQALGVFLMCWLIWTVFVWIASFRVSVVLNLLFLDLIGVFAFQAAGFVSGSTMLVHVGGYFGIMLSVIGFYGAVETVVNETFGRTVLPNRLLSPDQTQ